MIKIKNYQLKKPFISFLPGIAGLFGKPLWSFYANRGQLITSFGYGDKNRAILEFYPANSAYMYERVIGFKTFIKIDGKYYSFFNKANEHQTLFIERDKVAIEELNHELGIKVKITYFTLPNYKIGALSRLVEITNLKENREIEILDGLTQILPSGIDYGGYKAVGNLLQSWMDVLIKKDFAFYKLRGSTDDSTIVKDVVDGDWGGVQGVDNEIFPATFEIDYVRYYQRDYYRVDKKAPDKIEFIAPARLANTIYWEKPDDDYGVKYYQVYLDGEYYDDANINQYTFRNLAKGSHIIQIVAVDFTEKKSPKSIKFQYDN